LQPFIIIITIPLAAIGAVLALRLTNSPLSISVFIGAILLGGIVVNNAIILIDRINFLKKESSFNNLNVVVQASADRLRPILMTSLTTIGAMLFMALYKGESANLWAPSAFTVIGGMSVSTLLTLFIVPSLYLIIEDFKKIFK
jgi:hydrophobic/amphiphilic exporter-1 (mainly G- bacteria), HAE1 family